MAAAQGVAVPPQPTTVPDTDTELVGVGLPVKLEVGVLGRTVPETTLVHVPTGGDTLEEGLPVNAPTEGVGEPVPAKREGVGEVDSVDSGEPVPEELPPEAEDVEATEGVAVVQPERVGVLVRVPPPEGLPVPLTLGLVERVAALGEAVAVLLTVGVEVPPPFPPPTPPEAVGVRVLPPPTPPNCVGETVQNPVGVIIPVRVGETDGVGVSVPVPTGVPDTDGERDRVEVEEGEAESVRGGVVGTALLVMEAELEEVRDSEGEAEREEVVVGVEGADGEGKPLLDTEGECEEVKDRNEEREAEEEGVEDRVPSLLPPTPPPPTPRGAGGGGGGGGPSGHPRVGCRGGGRGGGASRA